MFSLFDLAAFTAVGVRRRNLGVGTRWAAIEVVLFRALGVREAIGVLVVLPMLESANGFGGDFNACDGLTA